MIGPLRAPWTDTGRLQSDILSIKNELSRKVNNYEITSLNSRVVSLEHTVRELCTEVTGIRSQLQELQQKT